jgi:hypothetical protein
MQIRNEIMDTFLIWTEPGERSIVSDADVQRNWASLAPLVRGGGGPAFGPAWGLGVRTCAGSCTVKFEPQMGDQEELLNSY